jgi:hypothetical protein
MEPIAVDAGRDRHDAFRRDPAAMTIERTLSPLVMIRSASR